MAEKAFDLVRELTRSTDTMIPFNVRIAGTSRVTSP